MAKALSIALTTLLLSGCVVTPVDRGPIQPAPQYQQAQPGPLRIAGTWGLFERRALAREIVVNRTQGGILITNERGRQFFAERIARGAFRDDRGRIYQFTSDIDGVFDNPTNGRRLRLRRVQ